MIIGILVVVWIAVLAPIVVRHFRDSDADRSIVSFHRRLAQMGTDQPIVEPAHRLGGAMEEQVVTEDRPSVSHAPAHPRLRLVPADGTAAAFVGDVSWAEWSRAMADGSETPFAARTVTPVSAPRVAAYARVPREAVVRDSVPPHLGTRSQRVRRRRVLAGIGASAALSTLLLIVASNVIVDLWALASWTSLAGFLALMYYAMSSGMMTNPTLRMTGPVMARVGSIAPRHAAAFAGHHDDLYDDELAEAL